MEVHLRYKERSSAMHSHWDTAMCCHLGNMGRAGMDAAKFLEASSEVASLVLDLKDAEKVDMSKDITDCSDELRRLVSSSMLGQRVFGQMLSALAMKY